MASKKKGTRGNTSDVTVRILTEIRDELRGAAASLRERLDRLEQRQTQADVRVATELTAVASAPDIKRIVLDIRDDRARMNALEARLARLEAKAS